jgi:hypothetical protein
LVGLGSKSTKTSKKQALKSTRRYIFEEKFLLFAKSPPKPSLEKVSLLFILVLVYEKIQASKHIGEKFPFSVQILILLRYFSVFEANSSTLKDFFHF